MKLVTQKSKMMHYINLFVEFSWQKSRVIIFSQSVGNKMRTFPLLITAIVPCYASHRAKCRLLRVQLHEEGKKGINLQESCLKITN